MSNRILWTIIGVIAIIGGVYALANPFPATAAATLVAGWMFIFVGIFELIFAFRIPGAGPKALAIVLGAMAIYAGFMVLRHPVGGTMALTLSVAILFLVSGISKIIFAFSVNIRSLFWLTMISGIASLLLAVIIFMNWPMASAGTLGILLGVELLFDGAGALSIAFSRNLSVAEVEIDA
ncbi:HdeD family acid-resistance protein [Tropicimonas sp.]|uniref:HdeD family acid-resistance protein n=1 Tax=Tropicimonas sp. TaxID=2067044 RepID=UPI003A846807